MSTVEDALSELRHHVEQLGMELEASLKRMWIPVAERLPDKEGYYLANKKDTIGGSDYIDVVYWLGTEWATFSIITAWMQLPKPYEEGEDE